jgi:hypothetical protein
VALSPISLLPLAPQWVPLQLHSALLRLLQPQPLVLPLAQL